MEQQVSVNSRFCFQCHLCEKRFPVVDFCGELRCAECHHKAGHHKAAVREELGALGDPRTEAERKADEDEDEVSIKEAGKVVQLMRMRLSRKYLRLIESDLEANGLYGAYLQLVWSKECQ